MTQTYASRGALKLRPVLRELNIDLKDKTVLDLGCAHGGFVHVALLEGAKRVYAVDVAKGMLDWKLRALEEVIVMEKTNARGLSPEMFEFRPDTAFADLSFISLKKILPVMFEIASSQILALLKPQFELSRAEVSAGKGVIRDEGLQKKAINDIISSCSDPRWNFSALRESPVTGKKGNKEFFIFYERIQT
jgi:23S rRNA (cytidine1920-2'-O)/16S rRNA (cytidine1409-2'-O)-methyltransferase